MTALVAGTQIDVVMSSKTAERAGEAGGGGEREREVASGRSVVQSKLVLRQNVFTPSMI